ncbi:hypothetical protein [Winogradskyella sp. 4-2091]|uniref:hypothetical protein n=1 Tax=Winogradskyella sp. 4-2091 TaxID=3381659 RepID=UPI00389121C3
MEKINGVSFEDWGAACGNIAQGMQEDEVCKILGLELPVWQQTNEAWGGKLGDIMAEDMTLATTYAGFFTNPKVGKFSEVSGGNSLDTLLEQVPDYDAFQKIFWHQSVASEQGMDAAAILEQYNFNLHDWSSISMHYSTWFHNYVNHESAEYEANYRETSAISDKWQNYWKGNFKSDGVDLAEDIDF